MWRGSLYSTGSQALSVISSDEEGVGSDVRGGCLTKKVFSGYGNAFLIAFQPHDSDVVLVNGYDI